jgi:glutamate/tyrosine decarboxylase-like PLP-dependent enzyme
VSWPALPPETIRHRVFEAIGANLSYREDAVLGLPGSFLDREVFPPIAELSRFAFLSTMVANPNHIGCHTLGTSEPAFVGTQALEREVVEICAEGLLDAHPGEVDGYVASGGTESNLQAIWCLRNALRSELGVGPGEIGILCSSDTHYSVHKAADLLDMPLFSVTVNPQTRAMDQGALELATREAKKQVRALVVVLNMGTTMFGSVDDADAVLPALEAVRMPYKAHVDAAFGGFIYPLLAENRQSFADPRIHTITLDAHKMLQAPYGTGIHLVRKGLIQHVLTTSAAYVPGLDCTLSGSRSGANAVAVWMILRSYGSDGGKAFCTELVDRARRLSKALTELGVRHFRHESMNVVAMRAADLPHDVVERHQLVPDNHEGAAAFYKVVVMDHVTDERIDAFLGDLHTVKR